MLLGTLGASLLGNILAGKGMNRAGEGVIAKSVSEETKLKRQGRGIDSFGVEYIPKEIKLFIGNKNIKTNSFRIQAYDSIMCGYICIGFIDFCLQERL